MAEKKARKVSTDPAKPEEVESATAHSKQYVFDDYGNAERLVDAHGRDMLFNNTTQDWIVWDGKAWTTDQHEAMRRAKKVARAMREEARQALSARPDDDMAKAFFNNAKTVGNAGRLKAMLELARSEPGLSCDGEMFDTNPRLLAAPNGVIELTDDGAKFREARREDYCTLNTEVPYLAGETHPVWEEFLETFLPNKEERSWVQKLIGYTLLGGNPQRIMPIVKGPTTSGKTYLMESVRYALGTYAGPFQLQMLRAKKDSDLNPELARALPRRFIYTEEASDEWYLHGDEIKRLVGMSALPARLPHEKRAIERLPGFTPWMATNEPPTINGADGALKRRLLWVPFRVSLPRSEEKAGRRELQRTVIAPAVLAWAVEGWNLYVREGKLAEPPASCLSIAMDMNGELNQIEYFLNEMCIRESEASEEAAPLYRAYSMWCDLNNEKAVTANKFGRDLSKAGIPQGQSGGGRGNRRTRVGVRLTDGAAKVVKGE